jgi:transposase
MNRLSDEVIKQRLVEGSNYKRLYSELKVKFDEVKTENRQLKAENAELRKQFTETTETFKARIEELEAMVFGRKPQSGLKASVKAVSGKAVRASNSYRRPLPPASAITHYEHHPISSCHRCGHQLVEKSEAIRYEEDINLPAIDQSLNHKKVTEHTVEVGWCTSCGQYSSARDLRGQVVTIGENIRSLIVYLVIQANLTYAQTVDLMHQLYGFKLHSGEITHILAERRRRYLPMYEELKISVRAGPAHMDETSCPIQSEQGSGYAHVMAGVDGHHNEHDVVFKLADSRGSGNSKELVGPDYQQIGITDRYGSYKKLFGDGKHQICWAHLHRTARDITRLECLSRDKLAHVTEFYESLAAIYASVRTYQTEAFEEAKGQTQAAALLEQTIQLCRPHKLDPKKLSDLKSGILAYQNCLFLCLTHPNIPSDNNKAERALRKLVIKRKVSFGVKTPKGARTLEVLLSICQSLYNRDPSNFLPELHRLATVSQ